MAVENFTTYTEVDTGDFITKTSTKVTATDVTSQTDCYLWKDFTATHFNALDVDFEVYCENEEALKYGHGGVAITNTLDGFHGFATTDIAVIAQSRGSSVAWIRLSRGNYVAHDWFIGVAATLYYCTISRVAGNDTVNVLVYSDSGRTNLLDTVTETGFSTTKYRYCMGFVNYDDGTANREFTGYTQNLNLNEAGGPNTEILRPNSSVAINMARIPGLPNYGCVDEAVADEDTSYVYTTAPNYVTDRYGLPASSGTGDINSVRVYHRSKREDWETGGSRPLLIISSTDYIGTLVLLSTGYATNYTEWATNPNTSSAWTWDDIDALQVGIALYGEDGTYVRCTQLYVVVDYVGPVIGIENKSPNMGSKLIAAGLL